MNKDQTIDGEIFVDKCGCTTKRRDGVIVLAQTCEKHSSNNIENQ